MDDRHGRHRVHRHAGAAVRQADPGRVLPRRGGRARRRGLQLPARRSTWRWTPSRATRWPTGSAATATSGSSPTSTRCAGSLARPHRAGALRRRLARRLARRRLAAPDPDRRSTSAPRERGFTPMPAPSSSSSSTRRATRRRGRRATATSTPTIPYILDYPMLAHDDGRAVPRPDPPRDARAPGSRSSSRRARPGTASTRSTSATPTRVTAADRHTIYKNGAKEIAFLNGISATFMAKPRRRTSAARATSTRASSARTARASSSTATRRPTRSATSSAGSAPTSGSWRCSIAPVDQLLQALRGRELGADLGLLGPRQPHLRLPHRRPRPVAAGRVPDPGRRRQPLPRARGDARRRASTGSRTSRSRARAQGQRLRGRQRRSVPAQLHEALDLWEGSDFAERRSARRSGRTT